ncbi:MAG: DUF507 family protein [Candidatus Rokubacteria bacterium]|jgi:hypothetical protein|nr:DUF507 family protein [Candidatus Rokubacteria bacterium]
MRGREEVAVRFSDVIVKRLVTRKLVEIKDEARARGVLQKLVVENLQTEDQIDTEARQLLQGYARDIREKGLDYRQLFSKTKEKLARDRGFVL